MNIRSGKGGFQRHLDEELVNPTASRQRISIADGLEQFWSEFTPGERRADRGEGGRPEQVGNSSIGHLLPPKIAVAGTSPCNSPEPHTVCHTSSDYSSNIGTPNQFFNEFLKYFFGLSALSSATKPRRADCSYTHRPVSVAKAEFGGRVHCSPMFAGVLLAYRFP